MANSNLNTFSIPPPLPPKLNFKDSNSSISSFRPPLPPVPIDYRNQVINEQHQNQLTFKTSSTQNNFIPIHPDQSNQNLNHPIKSRPSFNNLSHLHSNHPLNLNPHSIALPIIDLDFLSSLYHQAFIHSLDPIKQIIWSSKVLKFIEKSQTLSNPSPHSSPNLNPLNPQTFHILDPLLVKYTDIALRTILDYSDHSNQINPKLTAHALYLKADLASTGAFPSYQAKDPTLAFRDFEAAANLGFTLAWFRIGREYEVCDDWDRAINAYEKGICLGDCACLYRMSICHLFGQITLPVDLPKAINYLQRSAQLADEETPQPAYILATLFAGEFDSFPIIPPEILPRDLDEAKKLMEKAAYLGFSLAQYKMGWCFEYSQYNCPFNPLLSVEYYSLASKQGECEADLALSKWFLCGAEGHFQPNEKLAVTFAEKAAQRGLGTAMFAIGYYLEVGIGGKQDRKLAVEWYKRAWDQTGNIDARDRLSTLVDGGSMLSRDEHVQHLDQKLVRKHTIAAQRNPLDSVNPSSGLRRQETMKRVEEARRVAEVGLMANNVPSSTHLESHYHIPSPSVPASPSTLGRLLSDLNGPKSDLRMPSQPSTPNSYHSRPRPSLAGSSFSGRHTPSLTRRPSENYISQPPTPQIGQAITAYQLSDNGPQGPKPIKHIPTTVSSPVAKKTQFNSFADMGIQTSKAKKTEECIIV
ncbi:hypothetical protein O181_069038 [Austropuccinia psidii MF-1]|uniref:HCP-like protein n=1 Tax=Austropuccinia psidii MF-1 TaxID=1389203 RepID=A0A9Q3EWE3_9BASI|nr:hypothetical protein [Austropuccinia psidii MF-1]